MQLDFGRRSLSFSRGSPTVLRVPLLERGEPSPHACRRYLWTLGVTTVIVVVCVAGLFALGSADDSDDVDSSDSLNLDVSDADRLTVLVTGYGSWGNVTTNPAMLVAASLDGVCVSGVCFVGREVPVNRTGAALVASELAALPQGQPAPYDAVVHLGLESASKGLKFELAAANVLALPHSGGASATVPCNKSLTNGSYTDIIEGGPCLLATTAPLSELTLEDDVAAALAPHWRWAAAEAGIEEMWSRDAGTFYCNEVYYRSLHAVRSRRIAPRSAATSHSNRLLPVAFMHLPKPEQLPVEVSASVVKRVAARMAGRRLPPPPAAATAAMPPARSSLPSGGYAGSQPLGGTSELDVEVHFTPTSASGGTMSLSVTAADGRLSFACDAVPWTLRGATDLSVPPSNRCWQENVLGSGSEGPRLRFDAGDDSIRLQGLQSRSLGVQVELTLRPCGDACSSNR